MGVNGTHLAISVSDVKDVSFNYRTILLSFPWESPEDVFESSFAQQVPACDGEYNWFAGNSKPHSHPDGFIMLTSNVGHSPSGCELVQTLWDVEANLLDGPHAFEGLFPDEVYQAMDPNGVVDSEGIVTTGHMKGVGFNEGGDQVGDVVLDVDRFGADGFNERLAHASYVWDDATGDEDSLVSSWSGQNVYADGGIYSVLSMYWQKKQTGSSVVLARIAEAGEVLQEPTVVLDNPPPTPELPWDEPWSFYSFAPNPGGIMVLAKTNHFDSGFSDGYDPSLDEPFVVSLASALIGLDGTVMSDWVTVVDFQSHVFNNKALIAWSGKYYGVCYNDPFETHRFVLLDEYGVPLYDPVDLFWPIPPVENRFLTCDVIAVNEDTFVVAMKIDAEPEQAYANGIWISRVTVNDVE